MGYIFEHEIEAIKNAVYAKTIGEEESITLKEFLAAHVHPAIKAYFKAEVEKLLANDRAHEMRSKRFPYAHPSVLSLQRQVDLLLVQHYQFTQDDFATLLDEAVNFQFNYLCRPQWTLLNFIHGNNRSAPVSEVETKLAYCVDYEYLPSLLKRYIVDKGLAEIGFEEFKSLLAKIDSEVVSRHSSIELAKMMRGLFTFVDEGKFLPHNQFDQPTLPINAAVMFFEDKQLDDIKTRLEHERDEQKAKNISVAELAALIEQARMKNEDMIPPTTVTEILPSVSASDAHPSPTGARPNGMVERSWRAPLAEAKAAAETTSVDGDAASRAPSAAVELPLESKTGAIALVAMTELFSSGDRKRFVKNLFNSDSLAFDAALEALASINTWEEASVYLDALFVANDVDPFSTEAIEFTDRVNTRYTKM
ncbi:MAG: hypothetical protein HY966_01350 [Ignavibacteriales bacterium]|nr:hypothetical protein [Ignavibacteriales bacterium]